MSEIKLFGVFGDHIEAADVKAQLADADRSETLTVRIDSPGGSVFAGNAIHSAFAAYDGPKRAVVESFAGSIASYVLTAFEDVEITSNGYVMIHNPSMQSDGDDEAHQRDAKLLATIKQQMVDAYSSRLQELPETVAAMMKSETYFNADEAVQSGFASRKLESAKQTSTPTNFLNSMPYAVVASVRPTIGEPSKPTEKPMADDKTPVAASVQEIKSAYPKMSAEFVLSCVEKNLPIAEVAKAAADEMEAKLAAMEEENAEMKAKLTAMEEEKAKSMDDENADAKAKADAQAKAKGNQPVAQAKSTPTATATDRWKTAVSEHVDKGMTRVKAVQAANRRHPGLREEMLAEANA